MDKEAYLFELKTQLDFVDSREEYDDIWDTIRYLEDGIHETGYENDYDFI